MRGALCLSEEVISAVQIEMSVDLNLPDPFYPFVTPSMHLLHNNFENSTQYPLHDHMVVDVLSLVLAEYVNTVTRNYMHKELQNHCIES